MTEQRIPVIAKKRKMIETSGNLKYLKKKKTKTEAVDDDLGWVPPTSDHRVSVVDVHKKNLNKMGYKNLQDWLLRDTNHVYIGRNMTVYVPGAVGSKWRNPFKTSLGRKECCNKYKEYVKHDRKLHDGGKTLRQSLGELKGKTLGCWCHPKRCHGHMLVELVNELC